VGKVIQRGHANYPTAILSKEEFREVVHSIGTMLQESSVLEADEQDSHGMTFANLQMAAGLYETPDLTEDSTKNVLALIDRAISVMEKRRLLHRAVEAPWENDAKGQKECKP